jgi:hypothetical protein
MHSFIFEGDSRRLNYNYLVGRFSKSRSLDAQTARSAKRMRDGDMWDGGRGYIGPVPSDDDPNSKEVFAQLRARWTARNVIGEITERMVDALLSRSPNWSIYNKKEILSKSQQRAKDRALLEKKLEITNRSLANLANGLPDPQEPSTPPDNTSTSENSSETEDVDPRLALAELLISEMWTDKDLKSVLEESFDERLVTGAGKIRIRFSNKLITQNPNLPETENDFELMSSVLKYITVERAENDMTKVLEEDGDKISITKVQDLNERTKGIEISFVEDNLEDTFVLIIEPKTKITTQSNGGAIAKISEDIPPVDVDLNAESNVEIVTSEVIERLKGFGELSTGLWLDGNILVHEMTGRSYISEVMLQQNRALNLDLSLAAGVLVESGFQEMITTNVALNDDQVIERGPTTTTNLVGLATVDQHGTKHYAQPGVTFKNPTPLDAFDVGENLFYRQLLNEARQAYILNSKDYNVSGESKIQSRQDFVKRATKFKSPLDSQGGWLLTTLLHLIAALANKPKHFEGLAVMFDCRVSAGELSSDEKNSVILMQEKGLIDKEMAMVLLGVEDPILTLDKIRLDKAEELEYLTKKTMIEASIKGKAGENNDIKTSEEESVRRKNNDNVNKINPNETTGEERVK